MTFIKMLHSTKTTFVSVRGSRPEIVAFEAAPECSTVCLLIGKPLSLSPGKEEARPPPREIPCGEFSLGEPLSCSCQALGTLDPSAPRPLTPKGLANQKTKPLGLNNKAKATL